MRRATRSVTKREPRGVSERSPLPVAASPAPAPSSPGGSPTRFHDGPNAVDDFSDDDAHTLGSENDTDPQEDVDQLEEDQDDEDRDSDGESERHTHRSGSDNSPTAVVFPGMDNGDSDGNSWIEVQDHSEASEPSGTMSFSIGIFLRAVL